MTQLPTTFACHTINALNASSVDATPIAKTCSWIHDIHLDTVLGIKLLGDHVFMFQELSQSNYMISKFSLQNEEFAEHFELAQNITNWTCFWPCLRSRTLNMELNLSNLWLPPSWTCFAFTHSPSFTHMLFFFVMSWIFEVLSFLNSDVILQLHTLL